LTEGSTVVARFQRGPSRLHSREQPNRFRRSSSWCWLQEAIPLHVHVPKMCQPWRNPRATEDVAGDPLAEKYAVLSLSLTRRVLHRPKPTFKWKAPASLRGQPGL